jgi:mRNA-degrading endonuclease toxin of MazEF toxin-antitoxin module
MDGVKRGDVVLIVAQGDYGKPRPAVIVQSDLFNDTHGGLPLVFHHCGRPDVSHCHRAGIRKRPEETIPGHG